MKEKKYMSKVTNSEHDFKKFLDIPWEFGIRLLLNQRIGYQSIHRTLGKTRFNLDTVITTEQPDNLVDILREFYTIHKNYNTHRRRTYLVRFVASFLGLSEPCTKSEYSASQMVSNAREAI